MVFVRDSTTEKSKNSPVCPIDLWNVKCTPEQKNKLESLFQNHTSVYTKDGNDLGYTETVKHKIPTIDQAPVAVLPENPPNQFQEAKDHVQKLLDNGIIQESHSPYCAS